MAPKALVPPGSREAMKALESDFLSDLPMTPSHGKTQITLKAGRDGRIRTADFLLPKQAR